MSSLRTPGRGIGLALLGLASVALIVAGCGGGISKIPSGARIPTSTSASTGVASTASATTSTRSAIQRLIAYSVCMRGNGVPNFPDPNREGNLVITPNDNINPTSPQYERAQKACKKLSSESASGNGMTPAQHAQALAALTRYVECMREHDIPMANPFSGPNGGVGIILPRSVDPNSEQYKKADAACKHLLPNGG
jgi:hypothetical protein